MSALLVWCAVELCGFQFNKKGGKSPTLMYKRVFSIIYRLLAPPEELLRPEDPLLRGLVDGVEREGVL